jgi:hypothetical protein
MLFLLWKCCSIFHALLANFFHCSLRLVSRLLPLTSGKSLFTRERPDDLERCDRPLSKDNSLAATNDNDLGPSEEYRTILADNLVPYDPNLDEVLSQGSTSFIARTKPGIVVKYPRFKWWDSKAALAETHTLVKDIKRNFEVEECLLEIIGSHPRIIRYGYLN